MAAISLIAGECNFIAKRVFASRWRLWLFRRAGDSRYLGVYVMLLWVFKAVGRSVTVQLLSQDNFTGLMSRLKLPEVIPPFGDRLYNFYRFLWMAAFLLALIGPLVGIYARMVAPSNNSGLMLGSRAGIVVAEEDATRIRFPVGPQTKVAGVRPGDDIVAIDGIPLPAIVPFSERDLERNAEEPAYLLLKNLYGTRDWEAVLTLKSPGGTLRDVAVTPSEQHIAADARAMRIAPGFLRYVDLLHVLTYPFLLLAAWFLHKRQPRDPVSCILSLAILLTMATEQPSATFLELVGLPQPMQFFIYDLGNICLLAGILLFPHGKLSFRLLAALATLPILFFLHGTSYKALFIAFMVIAVLMMINCLRRMQDGEARQQIKWALFGFSGYAFFLAVSLVCDMIKWQMESFGGQLILEMVAGLSLGIAFVTLQTGLLIALVRFRLYDAEFVISRSATLALMTLVTGALFAGGIQGLGDTIKSVFGSDAGAGAAGVGAAMATVMISPAHEWIHKWMEKKFHKNLLELRNGLPETVRDLREWASLDELLQEVLVRVRAGVQTVRAAIFVGDTVEHVSGVTREEAAAWMKRFNANPDEKLSDSADSLFRVRIPLTINGQLRLGWLAVGPRPDGTSLRDDEEEALLAIADPVARAIKIVIKRDDEEQQLNQVLDGLRQRLDELEAGYRGPKLKAQA